MKRMLLTLTGLGMLFPLLGCGNGNGGGQPIGVSEASLAWGDYDRDGDLDLAIAGSEDGTPTTRLYANDGTGVFSQVSVGLVGVNYCSLSWGDYDGDGDLDLALAGNASAGGVLYAVARIYRNENGGFVDIEAGLEGAIWSSVAWADCDNDGDLDLALAGSGLALIYQNNADGTFSDAGTSLEGVEYSSLCWVDYDGDGDLDLVVAGQASGAVPSTKVYRNDGSFTFAEDTGVAFDAVHSGCISAGDYDDDGNMDIAVAGFMGGPNSSTLYHNTGGGSFANANAGLPGVSACSLAWGDYDNDGRLDLLLSGFFNPTIYLSTVYGNTGTGFLDLNVGLTGLAYCSAAWGDCDADGDLDIAATGKKPDRSATFFLHRNPSSVANIPPAPPSGLSATPAGNGDVTFSWSPANDTETSTPGLTYNLRVGSGPGTDDVCPSMSLIGGSTDGKRLIPKMGNVQHNTSWELTGLSLGTTYYWSVQAIDSAFAASAWVNEETVVP